MQVQSELGLSVGLRVSVLVVTDRAGMKRKYSYGPEILQSLMTSCVVADQWPIAGAIAQACYVQLIQMYWI